MRVAYLTAAVVLASSGKGEPAADQPLAELSRSLEAKGVTTTTSAGSPTFTMVGCASPEWDQSWAAKVGRFYVAQKEYRGMIVTCLACMTSDADADLWANHEEDPSGWFCTRSGNAYAALRVADRGYEIAPYQNPEKRDGFFLKPNDMWAPIVIQMGRAKDYESFDAFKASVKNNRFEYAESEFEFAPGNLNGTDLVAPLPCVKCPKRGVRRGVVHVHSGSRFQLFRGFVKIPRFYQQLTELQVQDMSVTTAR